VRLILALFILSSSASAFEGRIQYNVINPKGKAHQLTYILKPGKLRLEMLSRGGLVAVIVDEEKGKRTALDIRNSFAIEGKPAKWRESGPQLKATGKSKLLLGRECKEFTDGAVTLWATEGLGRYRHFPGGPMDQRSKAARWEQELWQKQLFPLQLEWDGISMKANRISEGLQGDEIFETPGTFVKGR
jgi:hypothetical protein